MVAAHTWHAPWTLSRNVGLLHLPLGTVALQVAHKSQPQWVLYVHSFTSDKVPGYFGSAFPEADTSVVHGKGCGVNVVTIQAWK